MFVITTRVGRSSIHGNGVFACEHIPAGAVVWRFHPPFDQVISEDSLAGLPPAALAQIEMYAYRSADLDGKLVLSGDHARFLNHSDNPNTGEQSFASVALRAIEPGEEITCDYGRFCVGWTGFENEDADAAPTRMPHENLYTRLVAGPHGVGVFAIRDIPAGTALFDGDAVTTVRVPAADVDGIADPELRRMYYDFCPKVGNAFIAPESFNALTMAWYMNHSSQPNIVADHDIQFSAASLIRKGEELLTDYESFSEHAKLFVGAWQS